MGADGKRRYDRTNRSAESAATRNRIIEAAGNCFTEVGYTATTMRAVAARADVHVDTIYALVGRKPDLARELVERALSGTDETIPAADRPYVAAIRAEPDPRRKLAIYAEATVAMLERVAPLFVVLRDAGHRDGAARELWQGFSERRAANMVEFVADVASAGPGLRPPYDERQAADLVWATNSPEFFLLLTAERGWSVERYRQWLTETWTRLLLDDP